MHGLNARDSIHVSLNSRKKIVYSSVQVTIYVVIYVLKLHPNSALKIVKFVRKCIFLAEAAYKVCTLSEDRANAYQKMQFMRRNRFNR